MTISPAKAAAIIAFAAEHGDAKACKRFRLHRSTLWRLRKLAETDPERRRLATAAREKVQADWLTEARAARSVVLAKVLDLVKQAGPEQFREVVGALKIINDASLAYEVVAPAGTSQPTAAATPAAPAVLPSSDGGRPVAGLVVEDAGPETAGSGGGRPPSPFGN